MTSRRLPQCSPRESSARRRGRRDRRPSDLQLADTVQREARAGCVTCYVATVVSMMAIQASSLGFSPLIPFMKESWGMSYTQMGTFTGLYGLVALMMSLPAGLLAKRYGEKSVLSVGLLLATVGLILVALAETYVQGLV